ncbi:MAG: hypothetical protein ABRQ38_16035 [Candidatus Eremiobacterota bacterium]
MKKLLPLCLLSLLFILFMSYMALSASKKPTPTPGPQGPPSADTGNPKLNTFAVTIIDIKNQKALMYDVTCGLGIEKFQEFHGHRGASEIIVPFEKVKSVEVTGKTTAASDLYASNPYVNTVFHLTDGHSINVEIPAKLLWRGKTAFGEMGVETQNIKVITFHHEGMALRCPKCGNIFHIEGFQFCPYDGHKLDEVME